MENISKFSAVLVAIAALFIFNNSAFGFYGQTTMKPKITGDTESMHDAMASKVAVAKINGDEISLARLMEVMRRIKLTKFGNQKLTKTLGDTLKKQAMEKIIIEELFYQAAVTEGLSVSDAEVEEAMIQEKKQHRDEQHFQKYLEVLGLSYDDYVAQKKRMLLYQKYIDKEVNDKVDIPEEKLREIYNARKKAFVQEESVQVTDIVFFLDPEDPHSWQQVREIKNKIVNELGGEPNKLPQSDLYYIQDTLTLSKIKTPVLYEKARVLEPNGFSDVINANGTLHLVKLTGYRPYREKPFEEVMPELKGQLASAQQKQILNSLIASLKEKANIVILDTSAE